MESATLSPVERNLVELFNGVGPLTFDQREALVELFERQAHRIDARTRAMLYTTLKRNTEDTIKKLVERVAQLEDKAAHLVGMESRMSDAMQDRFNALVDDISEMSDLVEKLV